jgi:hypothetical protein
MVFKNDVEDVLWFFGNAEGQIGRQEFADMRGYNKTMAEHIMEKELMEPGGLFE